MPSKFKNGYTFQERQEAAAQMLLKRPFHCPVICEQADRSGLPGMARRKYLIPPGITFGQLLWFIRDRIKLSKSHALFVLVDETLVPTSADVGWIYSKHKDQDGFLYIEYASENTFG